jgi:hypothetical protein
MSATDVQSPLDQTQQDPSGPRAGHASPTSRGSAWLPALMRVGIHGVIWSTVLVPVLIQLSDGWRPTRDDAMISIGSYQVFSTKTPLVGVWSQASEGLRHALFGLGPLLFWLLAVPVRIDPSQGALWGAALVCGGALSVAAEAAWSIRGWPAALVVALVVADLGWLTQMFDNVPWNPFVGVVFLVAAAATAWAVAAGRFGWWPVAVFFSSVSAQSHAIYAVPALALAIVAPLAALILGYRPPRWRWSVVGLIVAFVCWAPPLFQQVTGHPGNIGLLLGSNELGPAAGPAFGLHALATAAAPRPIWLTGFPFLISFSDHMPHLLRSHSVAWGVAALCLLAGVAVAAWRTGRRELSALAVIGLVLAVGSVISFAEFPVDNLGPSGYLSTALWVIGMVIWVVLIWAAAELLVEVLDRGRHRNLDGRERELLQRGLPLAGLLLLVVTGIAGVRALVPAASATLNGRLDRAFDRAIVTSVEQRARPGPVVVVVRPVSFTTRSTRFGSNLFPFYVVDYWGVGMLLLQGGWSPGLPDSFYGVATHLSVPKDARWPEVVVHVDPSTLSLTAVRQPGHPRPG